MARCAASGAALHGLQDLRERDGVLREVVLHGREAVLHGREASLHGHEAVLNGVNAEYTSAQHGLLLRHAAMCVGRFARDSLLGLGGPVIAR